MSDEWKISYECELPDGRSLTVGDEFSVTGERGKRYKFIRFVEAEGGSWIDCHGGGHGYGMSRSIAPERVNKIKRKRKAE